MEARVTAHSQAYRLRERMAQADVQHGHEIRADLRGVRVHATSRDWFMGRENRRGDVFFCTMGPVEVRRVVIEGDGGALPADTRLQGLQVPGGGYYDLLNVLIRSNGDLHLIVDEASCVEPVSREREGAMA